MAQRRGAPRKVPITLAGKKPAEQRPAPAATTQNQIDNFVTRGLLTWFAASAARRYAALVAAPPVAGAVVVGSAAGRRLVVEGQAGQAAAAEAADAATLALRARDLVCRQIGRDAEALICAAAVEGKSFRQIAAANGDTARDGARRSAAQFRAACDDLARVMAGEQFQKLLAKS